MTDQTPFADLMPRLRARARRLTRTPEEAEDLSQEIGLKLWKMLQEDDADIRAPDRYAMIMLHNLARHRWRAARPTEELEDDMITTAPAAPARLACAELRTAIAALPHDQRKVMQLVMEGETSPQLLARRLGLPKGTIMSRLARARARLRVEMALEGSVAELI